MSTKLAVVGDFFLGRYELDAQNLREQISNEEEPEDSKCGEDHDFDVLSV